MATKATVARKVALQFTVSGSTRTVVFTAVRNWTVRVERTVLDATNNDSSAWRELVLPSTASVVGMAAGSQAGQRQWTMTADAVYDLSSVALGLTDRAQRYDRNQVMRQIIGGNALTGLTMYLGGTPTTSGAIAGSWTNLSAGAALAGHVEQVECAGSYDDVQMFNMVFRGNASLTGV